MLLQYSYASKEKKEQINAMVGPAFGLFQILKMKGVGSQRFNIDSANREIEELFDYQSGVRFTNIELRPKGIILWFRVKVDTWVLALPYHELDINHTMELLTINSKPWELQLSPANNLPLNRHFIEKMLHQKSQSK